VKEKCIKVISNYFNVKKKIYTGDNKVKGIVGGESNLTENPFLEKQI
jgi:hypothetical protein